MKVVAAQDQLSGVVDRDVVIAGLRTGNYYALAGVGARVWSLVQAPIDADEIARIIAAEYDVTEERCRVDLEELLEAMRGQGLIEVVDAPA